MFETITVARVSTWTLFKLAGIGLTLALVLSTFLIAVCAIFGFGEVSLNGRALPAATGLMVAPLIGLVLAAIFTVALGAWMALGLWLYSLLGPITLVAKVAQPKVPD
jgi:hypothetical protein